MSENLSPYSPLAEPFLKNLVPLFKYELSKNLVLSLFTSVNAQQSPTIDEIDALLTKVSKNIESAGECTKMAQTMNAKMVESKVAEKEALKKEVAQAEAKAEKYANTMIFMGIDTADIDTASISNMIKLNGL